MSSIVLTDGGMSDEQIVQLRAEAEQVAKDHYPSVAAAARDAGIAESTFHAWLKDTYAGKNDKVAADVAKWLAARREMQKAQAILPTKPPFQWIPSAKTMLPVLQFAHALPDFSVITTAPGIGKTSLLEHYRDTTPNVWLATMDPDTKGVNRMLSEICRSMGITERSASRLSQAIGQRVKGAQGLILVDEAQFLCVEALEQLRSIHARYKVGVVLSGNKSIHTNLYGGGKEDRGQLFSRVGAKHPHQVRPQSGDICQLLDAWNITDPEARKFLKSVANRIGALRALDKTITAASMFAAGAGEPLTLRHFESAWKMLDVKLIES